MRVRRALPALLIAGACLAAPGAVQAAPTAPAASDSIEAIYGRAGLLYGQQKYHEAIPLFERVVELDPRHGNAFALLGGSYFQLGDYPRAIRAFERALQLDEGIKLAYLGLVASNYLTERVEAAQGWVSRFVPILTGEERDRYLSMISNQFPLLALPGS
ncbi:MAG TPA: tetratricopeptide repeat protein [Gemmatimonadota bacterium]|nr:tetratricopeptide repeat protein [Gemmatimonadota bacterium]